MPCPLGLTFIKVCVASEQRYLVPHYQLNFSPKTNQKKTYRNCCWTETAAVLFQKALICTKY